MTVEVNLIPTRYYHVYYKCLTGYVVTNIYIYIYRFKFNVNLQRKLTISNLPVWFVNSSLICIISA